MHTTITLPWRRLLVFSIAAILGLASLAHAGGETTAQTLRRMSPAQLEQLFAQGRVGEMPVGVFRGTVLMQTDANLPRVRARLAGMAWKGKIFEPNGDFTNQWLGFRAVPSHATLGPSWLEGQPCIVLEYPPGSAMFANVRDELREIAPGVFLGRYYERCPCPKLQGYFLLEQACCP